MAKVNIKMPEEFLLKVSRLADQTDVILPKVLEVGGEVVNDQVAAIERLQHQDLLDRVLGFARSRTEQQATRQRRTLEPATHARHLRYVPPSRQVRSRQPEMG